MTQHILSGEPPITVVLRRSARARRISLRVSRLDGRVTLTIPAKTSEREALAFAESKLDWVRGHLADRPEQIDVQLGTELPFQGDLIEVVAGQGRNVRLQEGQVAVPGPDERVGARLQGFLKEEARRRLIAAVDGYAAALGRPYSKITLRDTRSRWGSCNSAGALMFSWRLILGPSEVLSYVAAHEVAHLAQMNHSQAFWDVVERIYGPHKDERRWLKDHGEKLHRYRFDG
ncbi:SprT family zinc-dependent metalloprotease [Cognatishimia sp. 1_MG-2023]|uniref:M48 family metallopeptidase n=1 Tax=Cognatishimia sp. 1_MG-2023 TaxID=3062642 RepID=UPI0026E2FCF1|nr:SprT family zinc-dependent metalloprotease [Cognatishimia sp. 1_MG-2023]MDO6727602.1 SprT family zinc-dependent metalloprotease [Cognatishimia sp. 1_MG-2023]